MAKKAVTLFIDDTEIKLLVAKGKRVQKWARLPLETGLVKDGVILDEDQMAERLKELFQMTKVTPGKVITGLSGLNSIYRLITLPELPEAVQDEAIRHEARRVVPVSLDQVYLAYQPMPGPQGETRLFLAAFPKNATDTLIRVLHKVDVDPYLMDLAPLALCRNADEPRAIIVNAWSTNLDIVIMVDRVPQVIRSMSVSGEAASLAEILPVITEELERTIAFYNTTHQENHLDSTVPVLVSGDLAESPESWESLAGRSGYSVSSLTSPMETTEGFNPNQFMVNIGLALKELSLEKEENNVSLVNFNAAPHFIKPKGRPLGRILIPIAIAVIFAGALYYTIPAFLESRAATKDLRAQLPAAERLVLEHQREISTLEKKIGDIPAIEPLEATAWTFEDTFINLGLERAKVDGDMTQIVNAVPDEVDLTAVNHITESVTVTGIAQTEDRIFTYARSLRSGGRFTLVVISSIEVDILQIGEEDDQEEIERLKFEFLLR